MYRISVVVPTYYDWDRIHLCVQALQRQTYSQEKLEVIIVNNAPNDPAPILELPGNFRLITEAKPGSYAARNAALSLAKGDIIAFTDSDCIPDKDWLKNAVARLESGAERVAGRVELFYASPKLTLSDIYEKAFAFNQEGNAEKGASVTGNMITWRKYFDKVGMFNDNLMSGGDIEWGLRANDLGIKISYAPEVVVRHPARGDFSEILKKRRRVAGGVITSDRKETHQSVLMLVLRGYLPPLRKLMSPWMKQELSFSEKIKLMFITYFLKVYVTTYKLKLKFGLIEPERS